MSPVPEPCNETINVENLTVDLGEIEIKNDVGNPVPVAGTVDVGNFPLTQAVTGPLTDAELRATPVPVSGTVTITDGAGPVTVDGTVSVGNFPANQTVTVDSEVAASFTHGQNSDIDSGAAEQIVVASNPSKHGVIVKAMPNNTGYLYVGTVGVTSATGFPLDAGESITIPVDNANKVYAIGSIDNQAAAWVAA